jgi:hypothetical protein
LVVLVALPVVTLKWYTSHHLEHHIELQAKSAGEMFHQEWEGDAQLLENHFPSVMADACIQQAYLARDRERLQQCAEPLFKHLHAKYRTTHFYFISPEREAILRVHHPRRHGDVIERFTLNQAVASGKVARGIELGNFGTFTLRVVTPWWVDGELIGYIELGEEIEHFTPRVKDIFDVDLLFVINKQFTSQEKWEEGQRMLGNHEDWDEYPDFVVIDRTAHILTPELSVYGHFHGKGEGKDEVLEFMDEGRNLHASALPLVDAGGRSVGHMIVFFDSTTARQDAARVISYVGVIAFVISALLAIFMWLYLGYIQSAVQRAEKNREELQHEHEDSEAVQQEREGALVREKQRYQRVAHEEQTLSSLLRMALAPTVMEEYLQLSLEKLINSIPWMDHLPEGVVFLTDPDAQNEELHLIASYNLAPQLIKLCNRVSPGTCLCGRSAKSKEVVFADAIDERHDIAFEEMTPHGHYAIPLLHENKVIGVYTLYLPHGASQNSLDKTFLVRVAEVLSLGVCLRRRQGVSE